MAWWKFWERFLRNLYPHELILERKIVDTNTIKTRLSNLGWAIRELPIRSKHAGAGPHEIVMWKLIAIKGERSFEISGKSLDEAMLNLGRSMGVCSKGES